MATQRASTYAPNQVTVVITQDQSGIAHIISGYSEDSIVSIERSAETFTMYTGADNTMTRIYNANTSATITLSLQQTSASNDILSLLYQNDAASLTSDTMFSIQVKDNSGRSNYFSDNAYVGVVPNSAFSNSMNTRDWVIHAADLQTYIGGNAKLVPADQDTIQTLGGTLDARWL
jgi:GTP-dependent phosphoenolpyruvate carboxykinase